MASQIFLFSLIHMLLKIPGQISVYLNLYQAAKQCNWHKAEDILLENKKKTIGRSITESRESVLHIAFASKHMAFIKVVRILSDEDLERTNVDGDTALCFAAKLGIVRIAKEMVKKNNRLPLIRSSEGRTPLCIAVLFGHIDTWRCIYAP